MHARSLRAGADKITVNTAAVERPELLSRTIERSSARRPWCWRLTRSASDQNWQVRVRGGREATPLKAKDWAQRGVEMGAGEILLTSVDRDGTQSGFDLELTAAISQAVSVPVIASGGAKLPAHFLEVFTTRRCRCRAGRIDLSRPGAIDPCAEGISATNMA